MAKKKSSKPAAKTFPVVYVIAICDAVARDPNSHKSTVYGIFDSLIAPKLPAEVFFSVYVRIHGEPGVRKLQLKLLDEAGGVVKDAGGPEFEFDFGKQPVAEMSVRVVGLSLGRGKYRIAVFCEKKNIGMSYPLVVAKGKGEKKQSKAKS